MRAGDVVEVKTAKGDVYRGILLEGPKNVILLKLKNGYNIGFKKSQVKKIKKIGEAPLLAFPRAKLKRKTRQSVVTLISTGGTIGSRVDYRTGAVHMLLKPEELLASVPELSKIVNLNLLTPFALASEDMSPNEWAKLADLAAKELNSGARGVLITHGTDTLHFTASALAFMLRNLSKPVAIVGAQRSSDRGSFDGAMNLICGAYYCLSDFAEVALVMHATESDDYCFALRGTKVRKMHTSRRDTFRPINCLPLAKIWPNGKFEQVSAPIGWRSDGKVIADTKFERKIALVKAYPGSDPAIIDFYRERGYRGLVIEATGLGHVPTQPIKKSASWLPAIKRAVKGGMLICAATQCLYGRLNPYVYTNGRLLKDAGVLHLDDMLPETAYVKLGWVLGHTKEPEEAKTMMMQNIAGELSQKQIVNTFLY